jgi:hypothetical protein
MMIGLIGLDSDSGAHVKQEADESNAMAAQETLTEDTSDTSFVPKGKESKGRHGSKDVDSDGDASAVVLGLAFVKRLVCTCNGTWGRQIREVHSDYLRSSRMTTEKWLKENGTVKEHAH